MTRVAVSLVLVAATYSLVLASADPVDLATAIAVAAVVLLTFRRFLLAGPPVPGPSLASRVVALPAFALAVLRDVVVGTWRVALIVLRVRPLRSPGIVAVPFGDRTETGVRVASLVATLSPGEFLVDLDRERRVMLMHVIDATDPDEVRRQHELFYRRFQQKVFP